MTQEQQDYLDQLSPTHPDPSQRIDVYVPVVVGGEVLFDGNRRYHANQNGRISKISAEGKTVFEVGCNTGYIAFRLAEQGAKYVLSIDKKENLIELCNTIKNVDEVNNVDFICMDKGELPSSECVIRSNPNFQFDIGLLMSNWDYDFCIKEIKQYGDYAPVWYIEPTNHEPHYKTEEEILEWGQNELSKLGDVEFLMYTDYQHRGLFRLTLNERYKD